MITPSYIHPQLTYKYNDSEVGPDISEHYQSQNYYIYGERNCSAEIKPDSQNILDMCPYFVELNYDANRFPQILLNSRCRCENCIGIPKDLSRTEETMCKAITVKERVLRRQLTPKGKPRCKNGKAWYEPAWEDIPIACACVINVAEKPS